MKNKYVIFVGGETGGPISPLLALAKTWQNQDSAFTPIFVDVKKSVAARIVPKKGFQFKTILAGKFRRYWTIKNVLSPIQILIGFIQSLILLTKYKPEVVVGAGGYVQIPLVLAAFVLRIPRLIHQQDIVPTMSNKLVAPFANRITTTFEKSVKDFPQGLGLVKNYAKYNKVVWTGNPSYFSDPNYVLPTKKEAQKLFKLQADWPTVLVNGGGSGAKGLNEALIHNLPELLKIAQVVHSTGPGKSIKPPSDNPAVHDRYHQFEYIENMDAALVAADVVISRAGIGAITELSGTKKVSIIIPMPNSHQEWNAKFLYDHDAAIVVDQLDITPELFAKIVRKVLFDLALQRKIQDGISKIMPSSANEKVLKVIQSLINEIHSTDK